MIHLHIGRHKTGTSAIQHFLALNRDELARRGYLYPEPGDGIVAHHLLARTLDPQPTPPGGVTKPLDPTEIARFAALGGAAPHLVISSERFQSADPAVVRAVWPDEEVEVIIYLREPLAYMLSSYAQEVQARCIRTTLVSHARSFRPDYVNFVERWAEVFGPDAIRLRIYEREQLSHQDVRRDFCEVLGLDPEGLDFAPRDANPSLSPELIEFKGIVNAVLSLERQTELKLYRVLSGTALRFPNRVHPGPSFAKAYRAPTLAANNRLLQTFGHGRLQPFTDATGRRPTEPQDLQAVRDGVLDSILAHYPGRGRVLRNLLPADVSGFEPLLPRDWDEAADQLATGAASAA